MTTEVSGRLAGRSVFEPFSAHRASTRLKVGPNQGPTAPQEQRKAPRGAGQRKTGPGHGLHVPAGHDTGRWARARARPGSPPPQRGGRGPDRPRPSALSRGGGPGDLRRVPGPAPNTRSQSPRPIRRRRAGLGVKASDLASARPGFETRRGQKQPHGSQIPILDLRTPLGIVFDGEDDGKVVFPPFCLLHPQFSGSNMKIASVCRGNCPAHASHTHIHRGLGRASPSTPHTINFSVCVAPRGAFLACVRVCRELFACV